MDALVEDADDLGKSDELPSPRLVLDDITDMPELPPLSPLTDLDSDSGNDDDAAAEDEPDVLLQPRLDAQHSVCIQPNVKQAKAPRTTTSQRAKRQSMAQQEAPVPPKPKIPRKMNMWQKLKAQESGTNQTPATLDGIEGFKSSATQGRTSMSSRLEQSAERSVLTRRIPRQSEHSGFPSDGSSEATLPEPTTLQSTQVPFPVSGPDAHDCDSTSRALSPSQQDLVPNESMTLPSETTHIRAVSPHSCSQTDLVQESDMLPADAHTQELLQAGDSDESSDPDPPRSLSLQPSSGTSSESTSAMSNPNDEQEMPAHSHEIIPHMQPEGPPAGPPIQRSIPTSPCPMTLVDVVKTRTRRPPVNLYPYELAPRPRKDKTTVQRKAPGIPAGMSNKTGKRQRTRSSTKQHQFEVNTSPLAHAPYGPQDASPAPTSSRLDYPAPPQTVYTPPLGPPPGWHPPNPEIHPSAGFGFWPSHADGPFMNMPDMLQLPTLQTPGRPRTETGMLTPESLPRFRARKLPPPEVQTPTKAGRKRKTDEAPCQAKRSRTTLGLPQSDYGVVHDGQTQAARGHKRKANDTVNAKGKRARIGDNPEPMTPRRTPARKCRSKAIDAEQLHAVPALRTEHEPLTLRFKRSQLAFLNKPLVLPTTPLIREGNAASDLQDVFHSTPVAPPSAERVWRAFQPSHDAPQHERPPLPTNIRPPVWAQTRQEICETLAWFRTYQGGVYMSHGIATGYLLGKFASPRDAFLHDGKVIISHGGGGTIEVEQPDELTSEGTVKAKIKKRVLAQNQTGRKPHARTLQAAYKSGSPILLIADSRYALFPYKLPEGMLYVVLGWYFITGLWAELEPMHDPPGIDYHSRVKLCFQWVETQGEPWWSTPSRDEVLWSISDTDTTVVTQVPRPTKLSQFSLAGRDVDLEKQENVASCIACKKPSEMVYAQRWMCLNFSCTSFWTLEDGISPYGEGLTYDSVFTSLKPTPPHTALIGSVDYRHQIPVMDHNTEFMTSHRFQRGFCCHTCGRVSCRSKWECWECPSCNSRVNVSSPVHGSTAWQPLHGVPQLGEYNIRDSHIRFQRFFVVADASHNIAIVNAFILPEERGTIYQILGNYTTNRPAEDILKKYQREFSRDPLFRRHPLASHKIESTLLTQYFSQNSGAPYKFVASADRTLSFEESPSVVNDALELIHERSRLVVSNTCFNELLTAGYLGTQQMNFHSDFEEGLGNDVAALSLGSPAHMKFRARSSEGNGNVLELTLHHGDVLVMHGIGIQRYYEHMVSPTGFRIAATARFIDARNDNEKSAEFKGAASKLHVPR